MCHQVCIGSWEVSFKLPTHPHPSLTPHTHPSLSPLTHHIPHTHPSHTSHPTLTPHTHPSHLCTHPQTTQPHILLQTLTCTYVHAHTQDTFARAKNWIRELQRQASPNIVIALSGNKVDLASKRAVDFEVGGAWLGRGSAEVQCFINKGTSCVSCVCRRHCH